MILLCAFSLFSCGNKEDQRVVIQASNPETESPEELTGMGGADTRPMSEQPGSPARATPNLYYTVYRVKKGDMVGKIAETHGVSQDALISLNRLRNTRTLQIGSLLKIPSIDGILYTVKPGDTPESIADKYRVSLEKIALVNTIQDNIAPDGSILFLPDAKLDWVTVQEINGDLFSKPLHNRYYISSRYGWRNNPFSGSRTFHNGIDMAASYGTPIYAALSGRVIRAGYDVTYGNYIIVAHHSGYQTMYAHLSSFLVSRGAYVTTNTRIGTVGNTGQSTGAHLHFTVYKNRSTINPATLWH
ncbi:MAG TPA: M23 family metallopeptidase [Treponema sp.]|nr:M23 family metallopeptidase [Treponema sp.]